MKLFPLTVSLLPPSAFKDTRAYFREEDDSHIEEEEKENDEDKGEAEREGRLSRGNGEN